MNYLSLTPWAPEGDLSHDYICIIMSLVTCLWNIIAFQTSGWLNMSHTWILNTQLNGTPFSTGAYWSVSLLVGWFEQLTSLNIDFLISFCYCLGLFSSCCLQTCACHSSQHFEGESRKKKKMYGFLCEMTGFDLILNPCCRSNPTVKESRHIAVLSKAGYLKR